MDPKDLSQHGKMVRWECPKVATGLRDVIVAFFDVGKHHMPRRNDAHSGRSLASKISARCGRMCGRLQGGQPLVRREAGGGHPGKVSLVPPEAGQVHQPESCGGARYNLVA